MAIRPDTGSWWGFADSFGERATAFDAEGRSIERLRLAPVWTPAGQTLADRISSLDVEFAALARTLALELDEPSGCLILVSEQPCGPRLSELLRRATERIIVADLGAALFLMRRLLTIADHLQTMTGESYFGIDLDRIVVTASGRVMIAEPALAALAPPPTAAADVAGIAVAGLAVLLGHAIDDVGNLDPLSPVLQEAAEVAAIRAGDQFATDLRLWFDHAIVNDPSLCFRSFRQARLELLRIKPPRAAHCVASRRMLKAFIDELAIDPEMAVREASRIRAIRARQRTRWKSIGAPDAAALTVENDALAHEPAPIHGEPEAVGHGEPEAADLADPIGAATVEIQQRPENEIPAIIEVPAEPTSEPAAQSWFRSIAQQFGLGSRLQSPSPAEEVAHPPEEALAESPGAEEVPDFGSSAPEAEEPSSAIWSGPSPERAAEPDDRIAGEAEVEEPALVEEEPAAIEDEPHEVFAAEQAPIAAEAPEILSFADTPIVFAESGAPAESIEAPIAGGESVGDRAEERTAEDAPVSHHWADSFAGGAEELVSEPSIAAEAPLHEEWLESTAPPGEASTAGQPQDVASEAASTHWDEPMAEAGTEAPEEAAPSNTPPLSDDDHRSWIRAITQQLGLLGQDDEPSRASTESVADTPAAFDEAEAPLVDEPAEDPSTLAIDGVDRTPHIDQGTPEADTDAVIEPAAWWQSEAPPQLEPWRAFQAPREPDAWREPEAPPEPEAQPQLETWRAFQAPREPEGWREPEAGPEPEAPPELEAQPQLEPWRAFQAPREPDAWREPEVRPTLETRRDPEAWREPAARPEPTSWREDVVPASGALSLPSGMVHDAAPHAEALRYEQPSGPEIGPEALPASGPSMLERIVEHAREWQRTVATLLVVSVGLAGLGAIAVAGRSYYARVTAPGTVVIESTPQGSEVLVDGVARGVTPLTLALPPGDHALQLRRNGVTRRFPIAVIAGAELSQQLDWSSVKPTGTLVINSSPPGAKVLVDGRDHGVTPLTLAEVPLGLRHVVLESSAGTVRRDVRVAADSEVTINETIVSGWIAAFAPFELQIFDGARRLGTTDDGRIMVPPGRHELDFVNTRLGYRERRIVEVTPGTTTAVNITSVVGVVRITAAAGADVSIDGAHIGQTPLDEVRVPIGTHEVVVRHPQLGDRKMSITVSASAPAEVNVDFTRR